MQKIIDWLNANVTPKTDKFVQNPWVKGLQRTMMGTIPFIIFGSIINVYQAFGPGLGLPDLSVVYYFAFYLLGLYEAVILPYFILDNLRMKRLQVTTMMLSVGVFLMCQAWEINPWGATPIVFTLLGPQGIILALLCGYFVTYVCYKLRNFSFFKEDSVLPKFVTRWFDDMPAMAICLIVPFIIVYVLKFNLLSAITTVFSPIQAISNTLPGFILMNVCYVFFYTIGASGWIFSGAFYPILMNNIAANVEAAAAGAPYNGIATNEVIYGCFCAIGGLGCLLPLVCFMLRSKSKRIQGVGKGSIIPAICNINEPVMYGLPIVMNPILMIPMWLVSIVIPAVTWIVMKLGLVGYPNHAFNLGFVPSVLSAFFINDTPIQNVLLIVVLFCIAGAIWYPFFKVFEKGELEKEASETADGE